MALTKITLLTIWSLSTSLEHFLPRPPPLITAPLQLSKTATENVDFFKSYNRFILYDRLYTGPMLITLIFQPINNKSVVD